MKYSFIVAMLALGALVFSMLAPASAIAANVGDDCGYCNLGSDNYPSCSAKDTCSDGSVCVQQGSDSDPCPASGLICDPVSLTCQRSILGWGSVSPDSVQQATGLSASDPRMVIANVINVILGFLGIIAVILILAGGFMWMTAAGNDEKIETAKKIMSAGVVGLIIVLAAFGIAQFVVNALVGATS